MVISEALSSSGAKAGFTRWVMNPAPIEKPNEGWEEEEEADDEEDDAVIRGEPFIPGSGEVCGLSRTRSRLFLIMCDDSASSNRLEMKSNTERKKNA
jgi:hypothetical protein